MPNLPSFCRSNLHLDHLPHYADQPQPERLQHSQHLPDRLAHGFSRRRHDADHQLHGALETPPTAASAPSTSASCASASCRVSGSNPSAGWNTARMLSADLYRRLGSATSISRLQATHSDLRTAWSLTSRPAQDDLRLTSDLRYTFFVPCTNSPLTISWHSFASKRTVASATGAFSSRQCARQSVLCDIKTGADAVLA